MLVTPHLPDSLIKGYTSHLLPPKDDLSRGSKLEARALHSNYIVFPTSYSFPKVVSIVSMVRRFINAFRKKWVPKFKRPQAPNLPADFKTFSCTMGIKTLPTTMMYGSQVLQAH